MLLINGSMDLEKICISSLCQIYNLSFPSISIFSFLLQLPISSSVPQIIKELYSSSTSSYHFRHLSFNGIVKEAISSQNEINPIDLSSQDIFRSVLFSPIRSRTRSLVTYSDVLSSSFSYSTTNQSSSYTSTPIFLLSRSISHIKQCSKHNT